MRNYLTLYKKPAIFKMLKDLKFEKRDTYFMEQYKYHYPDWFLCFNINLTNKKTKIKFLLYENECLASPSENRKSLRRSILLIYVLWS